MIECPKCKKSWPMKWSPNEQAACIELFGECIWCRRFALTDDEVLKIQNVSNWLELYKFVNEGT